MKKFLFAGLAVLAVLIVATGAMAAGIHGHGPGHGKGGREAFFATALDLTDAQKATLKPLHENLRTQAKPLMEQLHQQMEDVHALLDTADPDPAEVGNRAIAAHATRQQLKALHDTFKARVTALLTDEQKEKLAEIEERHGEFGSRHHGFGGFGGFGGRGPRF